MAEENPFERYGLDPRDGITAITQRLRELAEDAKDDAERERIREAWEELTLHPARRLRAALFALPESRSPLGSPPSFPRRRLSTDESSSQTSQPPPSIGLDLGLRDLAARPSVLASLGPLKKDAVFGTEEEVPSLEDDPVLRGLK